MSNLLDVAERLSHNIACVQHAATRPRKRPHQLERPGPFAEALLSNRHHTTWLRDVYPGEARLLTLETSANPSTGEQAAASNAGKERNAVSQLMDTATDMASALSRRTIVSATPLRRGREVGPAGEGGDIFLGSALKLIDRYQPNMEEPRAHIEELLERYNQLLSSTKALQKTVNELTASIPASQQLRTDRFMSLKQTEQSVREVEARVAEARRKREALRLRLHNLRNPEKPIHPTPSIEDTSSSTDPWATPNSSNASQYISSESSSSEPSDMLRDEQIPSGLNFGTNLYASVHNPNDVRPTPQPADAAEDAFWSGKPKETRRDQTGDDSILDSNGTGTDEMMEEDDEPEEEEDDDEEDDDDETVILSLGKPLAARPTSPPILPPPISLAPEPHAAAKVDPPPSLHSTASHRSTTPISPPKLLNTNPPAPTTPVIRSLSSPQIEAMVLKIWNTVGEVILPGNTIGPQPPKAEETLKILQDQTVAPNTQPVNACTSQLVLLLLTSARSIPDGSAASLPMSEVKSQIEELAKRRGFERPGEYGMKVVYQCVAKKLVKLDRTGMNSKDPMVIFVS